MQQSFGKAGNAVCLHSSCVLRYKLQKSAFCNHGEYESFFSCGAKHAVTGTLFGCMAGNMWQLAVLCLRIQKCLWNILAIWALFSNFQRVCYVACKHTMLQESMFFDVHCNLAQERLGKGKQTCSNRVVFAQPQKTSQHCVFWCH